MPLYQTIKTASGLHIGIWEISEAKADFSHLLIPEEMVDACNNYHSEKRQLERCAIRALLFAMTNSHLHINYNENGRPFLQERDYHISISHSGRFVTLALHPTCQPGIDIEHFSQRILKVKSHVFSLEEMQQTSSEDKEEETILSILYWCAKETAFKIIGNEVYDFKKMLYVSPFDYKKENELLIHVLSAAQPLTLPVSYKLYPDFILTWSYL